MVENINHSRTSDQKVMDSFQEKIVEKVQTVWPKSESFLKAGKVNCQLNILLLPCSGLVDGVTVVTISLPQVTEMCQQMKEHMYTVYEENSGEMQVKLQELSEVLESCSKLNQELLEASQALARLREGLDNSQKSEL